MNSSALKKGNLAFRNKDYDTAISHYIQAQINSPGLAKFLTKNIELAHQRLGIQQFGKLEAINVATGVDIVVPVYNALEDVKLCLASLECCTDGFNVNIIVVNDGSDNLTSQWLREFCHEKPIFKLIEHAENLGYTVTVNDGLKASTADYVITQNSDTIVSAGWLKGLVRCMQSDPKVGIVGPLSNAATWQNVPNLRDDQGTFTVNDLPPGHTIESMANLVAQVSTRTYPRMPFVNGFCFMIKRDVINAIGYMDAENFPVGYGEENDYCIRALDAGYELAIADDVYVFHAKSKSFGHERRKELSKHGTESLRRKHTAEKYISQVNAAKNTQQLDEVRLRIQNQIQPQNQPLTDIDLMHMRILFLLPVKGGGGGAHSVVQEVTEMRRLGIYVRIGVKHEQVDGFHKNYEDIANATELFIGFDDASLIEIAEDYDVVVGTIFSSMELVKRVIDINPHILPAYYVQDYEPMFFKKGSEKWQQAFDSYTLVPNTFLFAKTHWIVREVQQAHNVTVHKVSPSIDHEIYKPLQRTRNGIVHLAAMIRPQTPRRGAERTMRVLSRLHKAHSNKISIHLFGCAEDSQEFQCLQHDFPYIHHGVLKRPQVADLLGNSDIFIDLSDYQAFGRTALEAMACGCASAVPAHGGADEYAIHNENAIVLNTLDEEQCYLYIHAVVSSPNLLQKIQHQGLVTAARYSVHTAAISEALPLLNALNCHRINFPIDKPALVLLPTRRVDSLPTDSGYVRVALPYQSAAIRKHWKVILSHSLPPPGSADIALIQRDPEAFTIEQIGTWHTAWKNEGGKLIYEIDDDLLDAKGLMQRGYKGDIAVVKAKVQYLAKIADIVTVSTKPLAEKLQLLNSNVHIVPNALDSDLWQLDKNRNHQQGPFARNPNGPIRIGYIGAPTHDEDINLVTPAMQALQKKYGDKIEIEVIGGFQHRTPTFGKRIGLPKKNDYPNFVKWLLQRVHWDIAIIPLVDDDFNRSKSNLKFLEYAALDMAIVCSDAPSYQGVAQHQKNCLVARNNTEDWLRSLSELIENTTLRQRLVAHARDLLKEKHILNKHKISDVLITQD